MNFGKSNQNQPPPKSEDIILNHINFKDSRNVVRLYVSAGISYVLGSFSIGVFGDNIYSAGVTAGVNF